LPGRVAGSADAIAALRREGFQPAGDLIFAACADEEVGAGFGLSWLCEAHPDAVRAECSLNEGAGERVELGGRVFYLCSTAEKMSSPFRLSVHGRSGHASMPGIADNALVKAARLVERLGALRPEPRIEPEVEALLRAVAGEVPPPEDVLPLAASVHPLAAALLEPLVSLTVSPTMIEASRKRNVVPALCTVTVDCRLLPGQTQAEAEAIVRDALGEGDYELEWIEAQGGTRSPLQSPLWDAVESFVEEAEPGAQVVPMCVAGFTDSHWVRQAFGTVSYGFFPARAMDPDEAARLIHSANERVPVDDLELGVEFLRHAARRIGEVG
jgi:acetylornithine deacetylase/succinyl-diaminopimelate desuccinylase-like protein